MSIWRRLFSRRAMVCREAVALMSDYLDGTLAGGDRERFEAHLAKCPHCTEYLAQLQVTIDALGHADAGALEDEALDELVGLYRQWRDEAS